MNVLHLFGYTSQKYLSPVPRILGVLTRSVAHRGCFRYAEDILIPNPEIERLKIIAPSSGVLISLRQAGVSWGTSPEYNAHLNYLTVQTPAQEFWEICHIHKNSCSFSIGDFIPKGNVVAQTGLNGWTTTTNGIPDWHVHFLVGRWFRTEEKGFKSLKIRYE